MSELRRGLVFVGLAVFAPALFLLSLLVITVDWRLFALSLVDWVLFVLVLLQEARWAEADFDAEHRADPTFPLERVY